MPLDNKAKYSLVSLALVVIMFVMVLAVICAHPLMIAPEVALNLEAAKLIVLGKIPYIDFFCLSSPLILYGSMVPLLFALSLGIPPSLASNLLAWSFSFVSVLSCAAILLPRRHHREWHCFPLFVVALALANVLMLFQLGQREHLVMLVAVPYFLIRWLRWNGHKVSKKEAIVSGVFAGVGFCFWDAFLLMAASLDGLWLLSLRKIRPLWALEVRAGICAASICLLSALFLPEAARTNYLSLVYPMLSLGYQCHDWSIYGSGSVPERRDIFYVAIAAILFVLPFRRRTSLAAPLVVLFLVGFGLYMSQLKGLSQSAIPMIFASTLLLSIDLSIVGVIVRRMPRMRDIRGIRGIGGFGRIQQIRWIQHIPFFGGKQLAGQGSMASNIALCAYAVIVLVLVGAFLKQQESKIGRGLPLVSEAVAEVILEEIARQKSELASSSPAGESPAGTAEPANCASWLAKYSRENDEVLFLTDSLAACYPLILQMNRQPSGYLLQSDCLVELEACERESLQPKTFQSYAEKLYPRLEHDIASRRAKMIFVQDVTMDDLLKKHKVDSTLLKFYELRGHARLKGANEEPLEHTGFNYNIGVFLPRRQHQ
jgi:hypothetical protein